MHIDYLRYYDLETYLWEDVHRRFHAEGSIGAFDFFCIMIWKAERAKTYAAKRLIKLDPQRRTDLELIVQDLTASLMDAPGPQARLRVLMKSWRFLLPTASAILSVFWPDEFSVYDERVCSQLNRFHDLKNKTAFASIWSGYSEYLHAVRSASPRSLSLRDADRFLWGRSVAEQLAKDLRENFRGS